MSPTASHDDTVAAAEERSLNGRRGAHVAGAVLAHAVETLKDPGLRTEYEDSQTKKLSQRAQAVAHEFVYTQVRASRPLSPCAAWRRRVYASEKALFVDVH